MCESKFLKFAYRVEFQYFSATQILREINSRDSMKSETANFGRFQPSKIAQIHQNQNSAPSKLTKTGYF